MTSYTSPHTGNTSYTSDDGRFSSMNPKAVKCWDETMTGKELERSDWVFWKNSGDVKISYKKTLDKR